MARSLPSNLGSYRLLNVVHTGQNCQIWQAYDDAKQCLVGIKTLIERFQDDREQIGLLRWEYNVGKTLHSPRIIETFHFEIDRGQAYLAMEWISSPNLKQRFNAGVERFVHQVPHIIEESAESLAYFHSKGWVHRDIKPDNFLVADDWSVKLIDFALARRRRAKILNMFAGKSKIQGTRSYMSPEQIRGAAPDIRADVYSFGCMVHELLSGKPPFTGSNSNELLSKHLHTQPPPLEAYNANVTPEFAQLIRKTLAKHPDARPKSMEDFLAEMRMMRVFKVQPKPPKESG